MQAFVLPDVFGTPSKPAYEVRVSGTVFIWGSATITADITFDRPVLLHIRNDLYGAPVALATLQAAGTSEALGSLSPGECLTLPLQTMSGVSASCAAGTDTLLACILHA